MNSVPSLEVSLTGFSYTEKKVLHTLSFSLKAGEMIGVIGPNGAGKSTLLKILAGIIPVQGVCYGQKDLTTVPVHKRADLLAYLEQKATVQGTLLCGDILSLGKFSHPLPPLWHPKRRARTIHALRCDIREIAQALDIDTLLDCPFATLSGGEQARVLLGRALLAKTPFLLADEPVAHLDSAHQLQVLSFLRAHSKTGVGVVVVLHDLLYASRFCDRILVLDHGRLVVNGSPATVLSDPLLASVFGVRVERARTTEGIPFFVPWEEIK